MPDCECHGVKMIWHKDLRRKAGGYWRCVIAKRVQNYLYARTEAGRRSVRACSSRRRAAAQAAGLCMECKKRPVGRATTRCDRCLNGESIRKAENSIRKYTRKLRDLRKVA